MTTEITITMKAIRQTFIYNLLKSIKTNRSDHVIFMRHNIVHHQIQTFADDTLMRALKFLQCPDSDIRQEESDLHRMVFTVKRPHAIKKLTFKCTASEHTAFLRELKKWKRMLSVKGDRAICERYVKLLETMATNRYTVTFEAGQIEAIRYVDFGEHPHLNVMFFNWITSTLAFQWTVSAADGVLTGNVISKNGSYND